MYGPYTYTTQADVRSIDVLFFKISAMSPNLFLPTQYVHFTFQPLLNTADSSKIKLEYKRNYIYLHNE